MSRRLIILASAVLGLHVCGILFLGTSHAGSILGNALQVFSSGFAAVMCFQASRRGRGLSRPFWLLAAYAMGCWALANLGWSYYENWLHVEPARLSMVRILFDVQGVFFAIALFLDKDRDSARFDIETILDSVQIVIVYFAAFFALYYVEVLRGVSPGTTDMTMTGVFEAGNVVLTALGILQAFSAPTKRLQILYAGLAGYLFLYALLAGIADYVQVFNHIPTGTWYDLCWSVPFLAGALGAAQWNEPPETASERIGRKKTLGTTIIGNLALALAPLIVLALVVHLGPEWRLPGFTLLGVSIVCYAARLGLSEFRQSQSAENVQRHALAMDASVDGMAIVNGMGIYSYANVAFALMMGYESVEEIVGKTWKQIADPRDASSIEEDIAKALAEVGKWFGPLTMHRRDGSAFSMEMAVTKLPNGGAVCACRDVTDRRRAENALFEAENKFRTLIEQVAAISYIAELGMDGQWLYVSPQIESIFGYEPDEWLAMSTGWLKCIPAEDHATIRAAEEAAARGEPYQLEYRVIRKDGNIVWVSDTAVVVQGSDRHPVMEGLILDITERKLLETQLQQSHRMEAVGRLAGGIAHDFNNLLTIIKGYAELASNRAGITQPLNADIQQIGNAAERASTLVRQLLAFSRKQVMQPRAIDLNTVVLGLDSLLRRLMSEDIEMLTHCEDIVGTVRADPAQIEQVIMNLVVNARDAMPQGGRLTIETANVQLDANYARDHATVRPGSYVMLAVSDTGVGMDQETQAHIFEPFYTTKGGGHGTGLGLSTVYGIVKQSGGYIWVYSEPGQGTAFKVYLPVVDAAIESKAAQPEAPAASKGTEAVLLVEDEEAVRELARVVLAAQGYQVIVAENPAHAEELSIKHGHEIQLLLTDVVMPGMSGHDLARRVNARYPKIRVLYMSGYTDNVIAHGGVLERGVSFLQKPFTPRVLAAKVREVLDTHVLAK
jgi:PAS domain S-box-containing protein